MRTPVAMLLLKTHPSSITNCYFKRIFAVVLLINFYRTFIFNPFLFKNSRVRYLRVQMC